MPSEQVPFPVVMSGPCWTYTRVLTNGYPALGRRFLHRTAWELLHGTIPKGFEAHHVCLQRACWNPAHIAVISKSDHRRHHFPLQTIVCHRKHLVVGSNRKGRKCRLCENERSKARYKLVSPELRREKQKEKYWNNVEHYRKYQRERRAQLALRLPIP